MTLLLLENEIITSSTETRHISIFDRLLSQYASQYAQSYFSLAIYFFLAFALCGLLAGLAYLLSLSTAQETEKRSEYECGFAPFDSATRLPFDVHFYLVGILFLIFDVEVALLFPWVLSLRTVGWFGFYLMFAFLLILSIGFLYEWKRGALLWPSRRDSSVVTRKRGGVTESSFLAIVAILFIVFRLQSPEVDVVTEVVAEIPVKTAAITTTHCTLLVLLTIAVAWYILISVIEFLGFSYIRAENTLDLLFVENPLDTSLSAYPMLVEGLLFILICFIITVISINLDEENSDGALSFLSWRAFRASLFALSLLAFYQLLLLDVTAPVLGGFFEISTLSSLLKVVALISACFVLDFSELYLREHSRRLLEYSTIIAFTTFFMLLLVSAAHIMSLFLSLVGFSLGLYVLIMYDASLAPSREAGLKYYYLSAMSSGLILYGLILLYITGATGSFEEMFVLFSTNLPPKSLLLACTATLITIIGFFFKLSAVPGHLWAPDVYEGSPAPVTAFFMLPVKIVVLAAFIQFFSLTLAPLSAFWLPILSIAVALSILWGAFAAIQEKKIRRFFAYASINQMGFLLMGLTTDSDAGFSAAVLYILIYAVMTCAFLVIYLTSRLADGRQLLFISDFRSLTATSWHTAWALATILFSMAGIPPLAGFFVKYFVLLESFLAGLTLQVINGLATSLISAFYYLRLIKTAMFESTIGAVPIKQYLSVDRLALLLILEALLWGFILFAPEIVGFANYDLFDELPRMFYSEYLDNNPAATVAGVESAHFMLAKLKQKLITPSSTTINSMKPTVYLTLPYKKFDQPKLLTIISTLCQRRATQIVQTIQTLGRRLFSLISETYLRVCACLESLPTCLLNIPPVVTPEQISSGITASAEAHPPVNIPPILYVIIGIGAIFVWAWISLTGKTSPSNPNQPTTPDVLLPAPVDVPPTVEMAGTDGIHPVADPAVIQPESLEPFNTYIHNVPTEAISFAEQYAPLRGVEVPQWFMDWVSDRMRELPSAQPSEQNTVVSQEMWNLVELVAGGPDGLVLPALAQVVYVDDCVSIFLYHPEAQIIEEVSAFQEDLEAYDFVAAEVAAALPSAASAAATVTLGDVLIAFANLGWEVLLLSGGSLAILMSGWSAYPYYRAALQLATTTWLTPGAPLSFLPSVVKQHGARFALLLLRTPKPNHALALWQPSPPPMLVSIHDCKDDK